MRRARPLLSAELVLLLGLLALVGVGTLVERWLLAGEAAAIPVWAALAVAATPMLLWLLALRAHEGALELSPQAIALLFALGAFVAGPIAHFVIERAAAGHPLAAPARAPLETPQLLLAIAVIGLTYEGAKYLATRYTTPLYAHLHPLTLLVVATAVALGVAAHDIYRELASLSAIPLGLGATRAAALALSHAACAAIVACALIAVRIRGLAAARRAVALTTGVLAAAAVHGALRIAHATIEADGLTARPGQAAVVVALAAAALLVASTVTASRLSKQHAHVEPASVADEADEPAKAP
jgi:hypothetical protein